MIAHEVHTARVPRFLDVEPERLAANEGVLRSAQQVLTGAWSDYLRRVLPPMQQDTAEFSSRDPYSAASA